MLTRKEKEAMIAGLREDIQRARAVFFTNLVGVPANETFALRRDLREVEGKIVVVKNTLLAKALEGTYAEKASAQLKGSHALAMAFGEAPPVAKVFKKAEEDFAVVDFKGGYFNGEEVSWEEVRELAALPSREEVLATFLAAMQAPVSALARLLKTLADKCTEEGVDSVKDLKPS